jgi:hypothetical protein
MGFFNFGEISPNFNLENTILTYKNDLSLEKMAQIHQFSKKQNSKLPDFYDKF